MSALLPENFGKLWWGVIESSAAAAVTPEKRKEYVRFVTITVPTLLPCNTCSVHFLATLKKYPVENYAGSEEQLLLWAYLVHSETNMLLGKRNQPSYSDVKRRYLPEAGKVVCKTVCSSDDEGDDTHIQPK